MCGCVCVVCVWCVCGVWVVCVCMCGCVCVVCVCVCVCPCVCVCVCEMLHRAVCMFTAGLQHRSSRAHRINRTYPSFVRCADRPVFHSDPRTLCCVFQASFAIVFERMNPPNCPFKMSELLCANNSIISLIACFLSLILRFVDSYCRCCFRCFIEYSLKIV